MQELDTMTTPPPQHLASQTANPTHTPLEDYALLSDMRTAALVSKEGSIDWLCMPRFDSQAVFTAILGTEEHGHWTIEAPGGQVTNRRYIGDSFVLETTWTTPLVWLRSRTSCPSTRAPSSTASPT